MLFHASEFAQEKAHKYIIFNQLQVFSDFYFRILEKYLVVQVFMLTFATETRKIASRIYYV
jgi:hypothetical protein